MFCSHVLQFRKIACFCSHVLQFSHTGGDRWEMWLCVVLFLCINIMFVYMAGSDDVGRPPWVILGGGGGLFRYFVVAVVVIPRRSVVDYEVEGPPFVTGTTGAILA